ncbi:hypothetical protein GIX45_28390 [Erwinia sp. CPCC 100877]|nr:hypothetical protein [Erwinia sp. CPCC 100877]
MDKLSDRAAEFLQEQYRHTLHYASKALATTVINIFLKDERPEPQYKDRFYQEELIATMDWLHEREINNKESMSIE